MVWTMHPKNAVCSQQCFAMHLARECIEGGNFTKVEPWILMQQYNVGL